MSSSSLPPFVEDWIDDIFCVYTHMQPEKYLRVYLVAGGQNFDCSRRFVLDIEDTVLQNTSFTTGFFNFYKWENPDFTDVKNGQSLQISSKVWS